MSGNHDMASIVSDHSKKSEEEIYDSDSGFISGGNIIVSGEISEEDQSHPEEKEENMRLSNCCFDSGVCLSESFSKFSLDPKTTNDLNKSSKSSCTKKLTPVTEKETKTNESETRLDFILQYYGQDEDGDTHLHAAIASGFTEVALALIRAAPHPRLLDTANDSAQTPLHLAVETGQWRVTRLLVVAGARPCPRDMRGDSPLHLAARAGDLDCVRALSDPIRQMERDLLGLSYTPPVHRVDIDQWNYVGKTCMHVAAMHGHSAILRHLSMRGGDVNARDGLRGYTPLHLAVEAKNEKTVRSLLSDCPKLDVSVVSYSRKNALEVLTPAQMPDGIRNLLIARGLRYEVDDDDSETSEESDEELPFESNSSFVPNLVNASA